MRFSSLASRDASTGVLVFALACGSDGAAVSSDAPRERGWATYVIAAGAHDASLVDREPKNPIDERSESVGVLGGMTIDGVTDVVGRDYELALNTTSIYELTMPAEPGDQLDWNKLPGLSDCNTVDLSVDGAMFGWRWRLDLVPRALEVTAYANNASVHLWPDTVLFTLDADDLAATEPLRYRIVRQQDRYDFEVSGAIRGRPIAATATLPRRCTTEPRDPLAWAAGFYFGGTSTAPHEMTARMREAVFNE